MLSDNPKSKIQNSKPMRVLHVLDHSLPYFSGYSFRSDAILRAQWQLGFDPVVVTSPSHRDFTQDCETRAGIVYHRLRWPFGWERVPLIKQTARVTVLARAIKQLAAEWKVDLIHAHSPAFDGLAAARAAQALGLPWVYELRYYDEDAAVARGKFAFNSWPYRLARRLEQTALTHAPHITTISQALRADLITRGIAPERITVIPNGVDTAVFQPMEPDAELVARYGLAGHTVFGFIGSFYFYEGLDDLIRAALRVIDERPNVRLLLVGDGEAMRDLRALVPDALRDCFIFTGNIAHDEVKRYYSVMDAVVYPRRRSRLTELTTPLKPLEAMAMSRPVVASNVGGLRELIEGDSAARFYEPGDVEALATCLRELAAQPALGQAMGRRARRFVVRERSWVTIVARYADVYQTAINTAQKRLLSPATYQAPHHR